MKKRRRLRTTGMFVQPDDLEVGLFYAVHSTKHDAAHPVPIAGLAWRLTAMNLPFVVGKLAPDPAHPLVTFDLRWLNVMKVSYDFVQAQRPQKDQDTPT